MRVILLALIITAEVMVYEAAHIHLHRSYQNIKREISKRVCLLDRRNFVMETL